MTNLLSYHIYKYVEVEGRVWLFLQVDIHIKQQKKKELWN